jgi:hypothetical protein
MIALNMINAELKSVSYLSQYVGLKMAFSNTSHVKNLRQRQTKKPDTKLRQAFHFRTLNRAEIIF